MLCGNNVVEFCGSDAVWFSKWHIGGEANLSQFHADSGGSGEREVESEKREKKPLNGNVSSRGLGVSLWRSLVIHVCLSSLVWSRQCSQGWKGVTK